MDCALGRIALLERVRQIAHNAQFDLPRSLIVELPGDIAASANMMGCTTKLVRTTPLDNGYAVIETMAA
jgi:hypothetical protein